MVRFTLCVSLVTACGVVCSGWFAFWGVFSIFVCVALAAPEADRLSHHSSYAVLDARSTCMVSAYLRV
jgi:hypothetical protein